MNLPFKAVLLRCDDGHYEATTLDNHPPQYGRNTCQVCGLRLHLVKTVTITPANPPPLRAAS